MRGWVAIAVISQLSGGSHGKNSRLVVAPDPEAQTPRQTDLTKAQSVQPNESEWIRTKWKQKRMKRKPNEKKGGKRLFSDPQKMEKKKEKLEKNEKGTEVREFVVKILYQKCQMSFY